MLTPAVLDDFGGLDFRSDLVGSRGTARIAHNVVVEDGRVARRCHATQLGSFTTTNTPDSIFANDRYVLVSNTTRIDAYGLDGAAGASLTGLTLGPRGWVDVTTAGSTSLTYIVSSGGIGISPRTFDGAAFATPAYTGYTPTASVDIAVTPWDNRVVYAAPQSQYSRLYFSDPGIPTTVGVNNYLDLNPGDGEMITKLVTWRDLLFVFKQTRMFVFYGTSTSATGTPIFNYRTVDVVGQRTTNLSACKQTATAHRTGVYFVGGDGEIYRTTGGVPEKISDAVFRLLQVGDWVSGGVVASAPTLQSIGVDDRYVYVSTDSTTMLCYDTMTGTWVTNSLGDSAGLEVWFAYTSSPLTNISSGATPFMDASVLYFTRPTSKTVGVYQRRQENPSSATQDFGSTAIAATYRTGWMDLGSAGVEKELRDTVLHGYGSVNAGWLRDYGTTASSTALTLGTYANKVPGRAHTKRGERGALYALNLTNSSGAYFDVSRAEMFVREQRGAGERTS